SSWGKTAKPRAEYPWRIKLPRPSVSRTCTPGGCKHSPANLCAERGLPSRSRTLAPLRAKARAVTQPTGPPPMTATSGEYGLPVLVWLHSIVRPRCASRLSQPLPPSNVLVYDHTRKCGKGFNEKMRQVRLCGRAAAILGHFTFSNVTFMIG